MDKMQRDMLAKALMMNAVQGGLPGQRGSQSGSVDESLSAKHERALQMLAGGGLTLGGIGLGAVGGGAMGGAPGAMAGGVLGSIPGANVMNNADAPNIQDVGAHRFMQRIRRSLRGLPPQ